MQDTIKQDTSVNNKRIAKNTILLYIRMVVMMVVSLYTSRVVLQALGVEDFGLYNIVGGIVVLFSILNGALTSSTQRFLNFELGKGNIEEVSSLFRCSKSIHLILIFIIVLLSETIGLWYINDIMNVPKDRIQAANWIYQFSIVTFCFNVYRVPYNASIIAHEKMDFYAYISIIEAVLKLLIVYLLMLGDFDKLIVYSFLLMIVCILITQCYIIYCKHSFSDAKSGLEWNKNNVKRMFSFSGWSLFGSSAVVSTQQGINLILNYFYGVTLNAASGIANQVTNAMYGFITNMLVAFNPQIVKLYAQNEYDRFFRLVFRASKYSFLLFWIIGLPFFFSAPFILHLWLGDVPDYAVSFCRLTIIYLLVDSLNGPLWSAINAKGKIKVYQIIIGCILLLNIPFCILVLKQGYPPESVWIVKIVFNIVAMVVRLCFMNGLLDFPVRKYLNDVVLPLFLMSILCLVILWAFHFSLHSPSGIILFILESVILSCGLAFVMVFSKEERVFFISYIKKINQYVFKSN